MPEMLPTPVEVTPGTLSSWEDVDISSSVAVGHTAVGAIIQIIETSGAAERTFGLRKNGSTDNVLASIEDAGQTIICIGVDGSNILEAQVTHADTELWLLGYFLDDEAVFFDNAQSLDFTSAEPWRDVDVSALTGADTALAVFGYIYVGSIGSMDFGVRPNGSSDDFFSSAFVDDLRGFAMVVDENEIFEMKLFGGGSGEPGTGNQYITGYMIDRFVSTGVNGVDFTASSGTGNTPGTTGGTYEDVDVSGTVPAGGTAVLARMGSVAASGALEYACAFRLNGGTHDKYWDVSDNIYPIIDLDGNRVFEQQVENTNLLTHVYGYFTSSGPAQSAVEGPAFILGLPRDELGTARRIRERKNLTKFRALIQAPHDFGDVAASATSSTNLVLPANARLAISHSAALSAEGVTVNVTGGTKDFSHPALSANQVRRGNWVEKDRTVSISRGTAGNAPAGTFTLYILDARERPIPIATANFT